MSYFSSSEILETISMVQMEHFDIRTVTMGMSLKDCAHPDINICAGKVYKKVMDYARNLVATANEVEIKYGIPIINKRISVTPISVVGEACEATNYTPIAKALDRAAHDLGINFIGGFSAQVEKGFSKGDLNLINSIPEALSTTERVCGSVNVASTKAGINMDAVLKMSEIILECARRTGDRDSVACAKLVVFCNVPQDNPFMAGAFHGVSEGECVINIGISGPGVVRNAVAMMKKDASFDELAETIKKTAFKITRIGEMIGRDVAKKLNLPFGIVDISLAPTPADGDSVANIIEEMGIEVCGTHGTICALALLNDAVKKGGVMATSHVGGLSGAFIPVSEDAGMIKSVKEGELSLERLIAMTAVCSVGLDMVAIPGDVTVESLAAIIADEMAIGMINSKTTACRLIPAFGKEVGDSINYGGLLGEAPIMNISRRQSTLFSRRGGRIPAPLASLTN